MYISMSGYVMLIHSTCGYVDVTVLTAIPSYCCWLIILMPKLTFVLGSRKYVASSSRMGRLPTKLPVGPSVRLIVLAGQLKT